MNFLNFQLQLIDYKFGTRFPANFTEGKLIPQKCLRTQWKRCGEKYYTDWM